MLSALRRCPASLSKTVTSVAFPPRPLKLLRFRAPSAPRVSALRVNNVPIAAFHQSAKWQQEPAAAAAEQTKEAARDGHITRFEELATQGLVHPNIINTITKQMKLENMTDVQTRTINEALSGTDVIAQAKTGTGKTLGFLIPVVQRIIQADPKLGERVRGYKGARPDDIMAIVISPTRELAEQIAVEARKLTYGTGVIVQVAVGGTQKKAMLQKTRREGCHLMVATPGRLCDILADEYSGISAPKLQALVMDEADRLLDDGFSQEIDQIKNWLPDPETVDRQTLMFSATVPREVVDLVRKTLKPGFHFAQCVDEDEEPTHEQVPQKLVHVAGFENIMPALYELILRETQAATTDGRSPFKAIVYFNSTAEVTLAASVFYKLSGGFKRDKPLHGLHAFEIHSKLTQAGRTKASDGFRFADSAVLFSSDVTARGMDFPNVTHVIQVGLPKNRDSYIHRLGRTGRAGKAGQGWLFLTPLERMEVRHRLRDLPIKVEKSLESAMVDMTKPSEVPESMANIMEELVRIHKKIYPDQLEAAFKGLFGSFQWFPDRKLLLNSANRWAEFGWGMPVPPPPPASFDNGGRRSSGYSGYNSLRNPYDTRFNDRGQRGFGDRQRGGFGSSDMGQRGFGDRQRGGFGGRRGEGGWSNNQKGRGFVPRGKFAGRADGQGSSHNFL